MKKLLLGLAGLILFLATATKAAGHTAVLSWTLSTDDVAALCTVSSNCIQNVYRAPGSCSTSSVFTTLTITPLSASTTTFTDSTITPGTWCYGVTFIINNAESAKDTVTVTLQPSPPSGITVVAQ